MWFNLRTEVKKPFEFLDSATTKQIIRRIKAKKEYVEEFLGEVADFQISSHMNLDMPEAEICWYTIEFCLDNADKFKKGYKAYILEYEDVYYIFVAKNKTELVKRISQP